MSILFSTVFIIILIFLILLGIIFIGYSIEESEPEAALISILAFLLAGFISTAVPLSSVTKIEPVEAEMAHNIMYVKYGDTIKEFPKLADIEYFKNNKEAKVTNLYNLQEDLISTIIEIP